MEQVRGEGRAEQRDLVSGEVREAEWGLLGWGNVVPGPTPGVG